MPVPTGGRSGSPAVVASEPGDRQPSAAARSELRSAGGLLPTDRDLATLRRELDHNRGLFRAAVRTAHDRASAGRHRSALEWCRVASSFAMTNPVGDLRSTELEEIVDAVAGAALAAGPGDVRDADAPRRVVHVLTEAGAVGGLTRLVARWIARDHGSVSSVVVSRQAAVVPSLAVAAQASGGTAVALGPDASDPLERAQRLRDAVRGADRVICHLHSDDVVVAAAFGRGYTGPPVALYNHADHLFWLAPSRTRLVVDARSVGVAVSREARGCPDALSFVLPLPIPRVDIDVDRSSRARLGVRDDEVIAISVAREIKFQDTRIRPTFGQLVDAMLQENPRLVFCAVGPDPTADPWPGLVRRHGRRVVVTGAVTDPVPYLVAADLYVDTFPFSSTTSLLEATAASLPAVTLDTHRRLAAVLGLADFLPQSEDRPRDVGAFLDRVAALVRSPGLRSASGAAARRGYLDATREGPWHERLEDLYRCLDDDVSPGAALGDTPPPVATDPIHELNVALLAVEQRTPLLWSVSGSLARFDQAEVGGLHRRVLASRVERRLRTALRRSPWLADRVLVAGRSPAGGHHP